MGKDRTGKFWWEQNSNRYITLESMRGGYDPCLSSDCRCGRECDNCEFGDYCDLRPWMVISSPEYWGEGILTPDGSPYGDMPNPGKVGIDLEKISCDIFGTPLHLQNSEEAEKEITEKIMEERLSAYMYYTFLADLSEVEEEDFSVPSDSVKPLTWRSEAEEDELDGLMDEALTMEIDLPEKFSDYEYELPRHLSKSHQIIAGLPEHKLTKKGLRVSMKNGSYSHGWRGSDRYKDQRKGKGRRKSPRSLRDVAL